ncbi:hypothetical protein VPH35_116671 [Triticum aestivum]
MKKFMERHRMAEPAMMDLCIWLWPSEPISSSYFGRLAKLCDAAARVETMKRSVCIEGPRMSFSKTMVHWPKIKPVEMATGPPTAGKEHRRLVKYFFAIMDSARAVEVLCSKDSLLK